jgi:class 3 adenylate cyclase
LPIIIVGLDQDSFDELDLPWPWPRTVHAELIRKLSGRQVKLIGLDYVREQRERLRLRAIFSRYVSADVVDEILEQHDGFALYGRRRHLTILFCDIRGFTSISEHIAAEQVVSFPSEFLAEAAQIIFKHGGTVDKFIGDAIMALFEEEEMYCADEVIEGIPHFIPDDVLIIEKLFDLDT